MTMANAPQHVFDTCSFKNNARHAENSANIALNANDFLQVIPLDDVTLLRGGTALVESSAGETFATLPMMQRVHIFGNALKCCSIFKKMHLLSASHRNNFNA